YNFSRTLGQESWLGVTYLRENQGDRGFTLYGADARIALGAAAEILAEYAYSSNEFDLDGPVSGSAYRLEFNGEITDWLQGRAYLRHTDAGFSNLATESFRPGQTRYGTQLSAQLSPDTTLRFQFDHERNRGTAPRPLLSLEDLIEPGSTPLTGSIVDNSLTTISVGLTQRLGDSRFELDWIHRDRTDNSDIDRLSASSDQIRTRLTTDLENNLTVYAQNELNLSSDSDPLYPNRTLFGLDWELMPGISLGVNQIFVGSGGINDRGNFTTVDLSGDYQLGEDTTIRGQLALIDGQQIGGRLGFDQGFTLAPGLRLDLSYERVFNNLYGNTAAGEIFSQPFAVGDGASALQLTSGNSFSVGLAYTDNADFQASTRLEHRTSSRGSNTVFTASALGRLTPAINTLLDFRMSRAANQGLDLGTSSTLKVGLAYRDPQRDNFNALLRYEYRRNPSSTPDSLLFGSSIDTSEHLLSAEAIYAPNWRWELYGKYAFRTSSTRIGGLANGEIEFPEFTSNSAIHLAQLRATYRLGYAWDITGEVRWIGSSAGYSEFGTALELGYYMTPDLRLYAGYSLGGAYDRDFSGANRSASGPYIGITAKLNSLFDGFGIQEVAPPQQEESVIEATATSEVSETEEGPDESEDFSTAPTSSDESAISEESQQIP
ncbi:MAG: TonB-dependent receptor, partial [Leptolyngbya sp. SIO1D8]|nr:TonB-dependent receptor [Leptolyngbya sp. SIO1D8]